MGAIFHGHFIGVRKFHSDPDFSPADDCTASESLPKGGDAEQAGDAGSGGSPGAPSGVALLGYADPTSFAIVSQDILLKHAL
jgi:hypothetical protein